jgi:hypothetical protein
MVVCAGSELSILYRNYAQEGSNNVEKIKHKQNVFESNMTNILSVSVRYFIDYSINIKFKIYTIKV